MVAPELLSDKHSDSKQHANSTHSASGMLLARDCIRRCTCFPLLEMPVADRSLLRSRDLLDSALDSLRLETSL